MGDWQTLHHGNIRTAAGLAQLVKGDKGVKRESGGTSGDNPWG